MGIAASVPIGGGFGMYGSYAHGFMDTKIRTVAPEFGWVQIFFNDDRSID